MMRLIALGVHIRLPFFALRDPTSLGVRLSFLLPPPRTILGALARGLGIIYGIKSGEEDLRGEAARNVLTYALEAHALATIRPLSPLTRSSQMLRFVPPVEKGEPVKVPESAHDAFKTDFIFLNELKAIYIVDINSVNRILENYGLSEIDVQALDDAAHLIDRIGNTEITCHVKNVERLEIVEECSTVDTYFPLSWLERAEGNYYIGELLPNLYVLRNLGQIEQLNISCISDKDLRRKKIPYLLPIQIAENRRGREVLKPADVPVKPKVGYIAYLLSDETKVILPFQKESECPLR